MSNKVHGRTKAREGAIKSLYQMRYLNDVDKCLTNDKLANNYVEGVIKHQGEIDALITHNLKKGWRIEQLNPVDLSILRLAIYELKYEDTPPAVVVNEALELAKKFSSTEAKNFIHHILDVVSKEINE